jgi:hypothetical protein
MCLHRADYVYNHKILDIISRLGFFSDFTRLHLRRSPIKCFYDLEKRRFRNEATYFTTLRAHEYKFTNPWRISINRYTY